MDASLHFSIAGDLDAETAYRVEASLLSDLECTTDDPIVVDSSQLTFIDSTGIAMLIRLAERTGRQLQLTNMSARCTRVFHIAGIAERFGIDNTGISVA
jgi:anti-anti-sigma factor